MRKWLNKTLKKILPDGALKDFLIFLNHKISAKDCKISYSFKNKQYIARFYNSILNGYSVIFPQIPFATISGIPRETPPYFSNSFIKEESIVIDAGSFPGDFTVLAAKIVGAGGKVLALEPNEKNREYLLKMVRANGVENIVEVLPYALAQDDRGVSLSGETIFSHIADGPLQTASARIPTISVDGLLAKYDFLNTSKDVTVKMDIEGSELEAFAGAQKTLDLGAKFIIAAYHVVNGERTAEPLENKFKGAGYKVSLVNPTHITLLAEPDR